MTMARMVTRRLGMVSCAILSASACQRGSGVADPFPGYSHILAGRDCPPAGRQAVSLVFRPQPDSIDAVGPQLRIAIWREVRALSGQTFASTERPSAGGGYECTDAADCSPLRAWRIRFGDIGQDSSLTGELEVTGDHGPARRGSFHAVWHSRTVYCI